MSARLKLPGLDLLRAAAILLVLGNHASLLAMKQGLAGAHYWWHSGPLGVDLFFALSGFLIGGILLDQGEKLRQGRVLLNFWLARWFRTLPNYALFLGINILLWRWLHPLADISWAEVGRTAIFCHNLLQVPGGFFMESWSLSVEEWFYLLVPLALWLGLRTGLAFARTVPLVLLLMLLGPFCFRAVSPLPVNWIATNHIVVHRLDAIGWGVVAVWISRLHPTWWRARASPLAIGGLLTLAVCLLMATRPAFGRTWGERTLFPLLQPLGCTLLLPWLSQWRGWVSGWKSAITSSIARWSYSLYLVNFIVYNFILEYRPFWSAIPFSTGFALLAFFLISLALAAACYHGFEAPILRQRAKFLAKTSG